MAPSRSSLSREQRVFINCPFDVEYAATFDALILTALSCGFEACSAIESDDVSIPRMQRIFAGLKSAKYSLHDLSRCRGEGEERLARFNMPLELGMAMALAMEDLAEDHSWAVLVPEGHVYLAFVSDLSGFDLLRYDGRPESVVSRTMRWLSTRPDAQALDSTPDDVVAALPAFREQKRALEKKWHGELPWGRLLELAVRCVPRRR